MPAIGSHKTGIDEGGWDGPGNEKNLKTDQDQAYYARMYAWRDPDGDPKTKSAYKFPHHVVSGDGTPGAANVRGCQAGIGVLNGAMGGAKIPEGDRRGVYNHLAAHLRNADVEPAELKSFEPLRHSETQHAASLQGGVERRYGPAEMRVDQEGTIEGYAAVFNQPSEDLGGFTEYIRAGAFSKTIKEADVRALFNHDPNYVLGRNKAGTLDLAEDDHGLHFRVRPPETQWAQDLLQTVRRGDVNQASFAFQTVRDKWTILEDEEEKKRERELIEVKLFDVSPVTYPAYPQTKVGARSLAEMFVAQMAQHSDPEVIRYLLEELDQLFGTAAPEQELHPAEDEDKAQVRLKLRKLKLELDKLEY